MKEIIGKEGEKNVIYSIPSKACEKIYNGHMFKK